MTLSFRGRPACSCLIAWLPVYEAELKRLGVIRYSIDIFQLIGGAAASGGTHSTGQCADIAQRTDKAIWVARQMGADASWNRRYNWDGRGGMAHAHLNLRGCPHGTDAADRQYYSAYQGVDHGKNGLANGAPDDGPRPLAKRTWPEGIAWAKARQAASAPKATTYYVKVARAYARSAPEITPNMGNVVGSLAFGKPLQVFPHNASWGYTLLDGKKRYWILRYLSKTKPAAPVPPTQLRARIMTFNVADKFGGPIAAIVADIKAGNPAIVAIQEGGGRKAPGVPADHTAAIAKALGHKIIVPTTDFNENYFLYDATKVSAERLPDVVIRVPGAEGKHVSRTIFTDLATGKKLPVCNTHLEHQHGADWDDIRQAEGAIVAVAADDARDLAGTEDLVIVGDLNTPQPIKAFAGIGLNNTETMTANAVDLNLATFSGSSATPSTDPTKDYDHIYVTAGAHVNGVRVVARRAAGKYVTPKGSDHQPVVADITF